MVVEAKSHHKTLLEVKAAAHQARALSKHEKKSRRSGLRTKKPYISSSLGAMCRHMIRLACTEQTVGMTEPPPLGFYEFWRTFSLEEEVKEPRDYVNIKTVSIAKLKQHTSSFDFYGSEVSSIVSGNAQALKDDDASSVDSRAVTSDARMQSYRPKGFVADQWGVFRESYSRESLLSHSTNADSDYEPELREGFSEDIEDDNVDSDEELREQMRLQYGLHKIYDTDDESQSMSVMEEDIGQEKTKSKVKANATAKANAKAEQEKLALEEAEAKMLKEEQMDYLIRVGSQDSFLNDDYSYGELSDSVFDSEFDFFNERPTPGTMSEELTDKEADGAKKTKIRKCKTNPKLDPEYIAKQKEMIEARLHEAVRLRTAMGFYKPPEGKPPLTKFFDSFSPGPAAYYPRHKMTIGTTLTGRWKDGDYISLGPGPKYFPAPCVECNFPMLTAHFEERFKKSETIGPGPGVVNIAPEGCTGRDKPHALILSRHPPKNVGSGAGKFANCYGMTRYGIAHSPNAIIIGRYLEKDKSIPGPGAYDTPELPDSRVGILMKSRIPQPGTEQSQPGFVQLPDTIGDAPAFSFGIKKIIIEHPDGPGPIYRVLPQRRKPISLTFKPFPAWDKHDEPSPLEYGNRVMKAYDKVLPRAPVALLTSRNYPDFGRSTQPGPNEYDIGGNIGYDGPVLKKRWKDKTEVTPGPANYVPKSNNFRCPPRAVFQYMGKEKKLQENSPGYIYTPKNPNRILGGQIYGRWKDLKKDESSPGFQNLSGLTIKGKNTKIPISLKSRHTPFKHNGVSAHAGVPNPNECRTANYS